MFKVNEMIFASGVTFNPAIDLRKDLYIHYGYTIEELAFMSDDQVFAAIDAISEESEQVKETEVQKEEVATEDRRTIEELNLSDRSYNCLKRAGIDTVQQLKKMSLMDIIMIRGLGRTSILEIEKKLNIKYDW